MNLDPLEDGSVLITFCSDDFEFCEDPAIALMTVRGKDHDLTIEQVYAMITALEEIASAMLTAMGR